jgi:hypothetical protein
MAVTATNKVSKATAKNKIKKKHDCKVCHRIE